MVAGVLTIVFAGVAFNVRERVRGAVADKLVAGQRMLSALEQRRTRELSVQVATLAENPTLKVAAANFKLEGTTNPDFRRGLIAAINRELEALAATTSSDVLAVADASGTVLAVGGRRKMDWPVQAQVIPRHDGTGSAYVSIASDVFQFASAPLTLQHQLSRHAAARQGARWPLRAGAGDAVRGGDAHRLG